MTKDALMPILRSIQTDLADLKRESKETRADIQDLSRRLDSFEDFFTFTMGMTERHKVDIQRLGREIREVKNRSDELERPQ